MKKPIPRIGGIGMFISAISLAILLCGGHSFFALPLIIGICMIIYALFTRNMKFMG
jgi:UDP-N-acetylmuramyl pentapeptide phosphotransferase/UDP-N-acetylglucosamine-1-phosphate transferase